MSQRTLMEARNMSDKEEFQEAVDRLVEEMEEREYDEIDIERYLKRNIDE